jgi:hypothetical protein
MIVDSSAPGTPKHSGWERHHSPEKLQNTTYGDADDAKWQQDQPYDGVQHQRQQRQRPAQKQQDAPQQKGSHADPSGSIGYYEWEAPDVPVGSAETVLPFQLQNG